MKHNYQRNAKRTQTHGFLFMKIRCPKMPSPSLIYLFILLYNKIFLIKIVTIKFIN